MTLTTYTPTFAGELYAFGLYADAAWAAQVLNIWSVADDAAIQGDRPLCIIIPDDYTFADNGGTLPATLTDDGSPLGWLLRERGWNVVYASITYADGAAGADGGQWQSGDSGSAMPERNVAELDILRVVQWARENASTYQIDTSRIFVAADGDGATAALRAIYEDANPFTSGASTQAAQSHLVRGANLVDPIGGWKNLTGFNTTRGHVNGVTLVGSMSAPLDALLSTTTWLTNDTNVRADARSVRLRSYFTVADTDIAGDHDPTTPGITEPGSVWFGEALDIALAGTSLGPSEGVPIGRSIMRWTDWSNSLLSSYERAYVRANALEADAGLAPVEEIVLDAVEDALRQITIANGYQIDVAHVDRADNVNEEGYPQWPVILTEENDALPTEEFHNVSHNLLTATLYAVTSLENGHFGTGRVVSHLLASMRKALATAFDGVDSWEGPYRGLPIVDSRIVSWERVVGMLAEQATTGVRLTVEIAYRDLVDDPYTGSTALT